MTGITRLDRLVIARLGGVALMLLETCGSGHAASFDCERASTKVEKLICASPRLSKLDELMARSYAEVIGGNGRSPASIEAVGPETIAREQRAWLVARNRCDDEACVNTAYRERLKRVACPAVFGSEEAMRCNAVQLELASADLEQAERARATRLADGADSPEWVQRLVKAESEAWLKYRDSKCDLYGELNGGAALWKPAMAVGCQVDETKRRITETGRQ